MTAPPEGVPDPAVGGGRLLRHQGRALALFWRLSPVKVSAIAVLALVGAVLPGAQVAVTAVAVQAVANAIAGGAAQALLDRALLAGVALAGLAFAAHALAVVEQYLNAVLRLELTMRVGERVMGKATRLDLEQYEDAAVYDGLQRAMRESGSGPHDVFSGLLGVARDLVSVVSVLAVLLSWNPLVALLILLAPVPSVFANAALGRRGYEIEYGRAGDRRRLWYHQHLTTHDRAFKEVRLFGLGPFLIGGYRDIVRRFHRQDQWLARRQSAWTGGLGLLGVAASSGAVLFALSAAVTTGQIGQLAGVIAAIGVVQTSVQGVLQGVAEVYENTLFVGNLFDFLDLPEGRIVGGTRPFPTGTPPDVEFRDVSFVYPGTAAVALDRVSFTIPGGSCAALVGHNGAGKTTIVKLLTRLYRPTAGVILVGGVPVEDYDLDDLRRNLGVIFQDFLQFEMTARCNVGFGRVEELADTARVRAAAAQSGISSVLERLPESYETVLGRHFEEGHQLSTGQWQKIALARAFMRRAPIVVLDEPTAAIDAEAEAEIFDRFTSIASGCTALLIAHRFSTVRMADHILVLEDGRLIEEGSHSELLRAEGRYAHLFRLQARGYQQEPATQEHASGVPDANSLA